MNHPLTFIPSDKRRLVFFTALTATLILFAIFNVLDTPLRTSAAPNGIVSFELAGTSDAAQKMIDSWKQLSWMVSNTAGQPAPGVIDPAYSLAAFGLGLDYLFMPTYALALSLGILLALGRHPGGFAKLGAWLGWGALLAPLFDATENFALARELFFNQVWSPWPQIAYWCATLKFLLLILGLAYALIGWLWPKAS